MARDQSKLCIDCGCFSPDNARCNGITDLITGRRMILNAHTARHDAKYCGPAGKLFQPAVAEEVLAPGEKRLKEPKEVKALRLVDARQKAKA